MKTVLTLWLVIVASAGISFAQASGNIGYSQSGGNARARENERAKRILAQGELPPTPNSTLIEASVLMNVEAEEYVAIFGVSQECRTVPECNQKMNATVESFTASLKQLGIGGSDIFVDFAAQNRIYDYVVTNNLAKEQLVGFELKKNISVHFKDKGLLDSLIIAASQSNIFDLIKVDYIMRDMTAIQNRLSEEAAKIIKRKAAKYESQLGIKLSAPVQVQAEKPSIYFPTSMYDSYTAYESENVNSRYDRDRFTIQQARKSRTFFFNALNADGFDYVINPVVIEPVVQFTLYLRVRYETAEPPK
ncbi:MAG: SIMPL domain-containing protein [Pyrinomonadaceae bacterium]